MIPIPAADLEGHGPGGYGPVRLLVVQPTPFCNLDCDYCYLPDRGDRSRLPLAVLEAAVERVLESPYFGGEFTLLWHAGEPLMAPIAFYDEATQRIGRLLEGRGLPASTVVQSLQTNATTIDGAWCDCFERNGIHVGVSMDGPAFLHDAHRVTRTGLPTHAAVMRGIDWLARRRIPFQVICVLTADALDHADAIADFFLQHGIVEVIELAGELRRPSAAHQRIRHRERLAEARHARGDVSQRIAEHAMLTLLPAGAQPQHHAPAAQFGQLQRLPREHDRIAKRDGRDARAELDAFGAIGQPGQRYHEFERIALGRHGISEVVGAIEPAETERLDGAGEAAPAIPRQALLAFDHDGDIEHG